MYYNFLKLQYIFISCSKFSLVESVSGAGQQDIKLPCYMIATVTALMLPSDVTT